MDESGLNIQSPGKDEWPIQFSESNAFVGKIINWSISAIIMIYLITLMVGLITLPDPNEPIGNPYFTILELIILILGPLMVFSFAILHVSTPNELKIYSFTALILIAIMAGITCCTHFLILTLSHQKNIIDQSWSPVVFLFKWPSFVYAFDILAWDFFFPLSMFFLAATFRKKGLEKVLCRLLIVSGVVSFIGLLGIPTNNMHIRNIGIIGYTFVAIINFFLLGVVLRQRVTIK